MPVQVSMGRGLTRLSHHVICPWSMGQWLRMCNLVLQCMWNICVDEFKAVLHTKWLWCSAACTLSCFMAWFASTRVHIVSEQLLLKECVICYADNRTGPRAPPCGTMQHLLLDQNNGSRHAPMSQYPFFRYLHSLFDEPNSYARWIFNVMIWAPVFTPFQTFMD